MSRKEHKGWMSEYEQGYVSGYNEACGELEARLADAERLLREARGWLPADTILGDMIDAFLARENERE